MTYAASQITLLYVLAGAWGGGGGGEGPTWG